jgi:polyhydroxyalkanoate synthesis regulator phasin
MKMKKSAMMDRLCKGGMSKEAARDFLKAMPADSYEDDEIEEESADIEDLNKSLGALASKTRRVAELEAQIVELADQNDALVKSLSTADEIAESSAATLDSVLSKSFAAFKHVEDNQAKLAEAMLGLSAKLDDLTKSLGAPAPPRALSGGNYTPPPVNKDGNGNAERDAFKGLIKSMYDNARAKGNTEAIRAVASVEAKVRDGIMSPADARVALQGLN